MLLEGPQCENYSSKVTMHPWSISGHLMNNPPLHRHNVSSTSGEVWGLSTLIFNGRTDAKAEAPILWPPDAKSQLIGKDLDAGKDWGQKEKWETEDMMVGWYRWLNGHEFEQALGDSEGWESLVRYSPWGHEESDTTEWLSSNYHHNVSFPFWMLWVFQLKKKNQ